MTSTTDKVVLLGQNKSLVAIVTQSAATNDPVLPAVLILNSGIIHRVGHNRMYVSLSRELAALGHVVLRLDLSGIGDSEPRPDILDPHAAALADIKDAVDWLGSSRAAKRVVLMGLCSGANQSIAYAGSDSRIVGAVLLDPSIPRTPRFYFKYFGLRLKGTKYWTNFLLGRVNIWSFFAKLLPRSGSGEWNFPQSSLEDPRIRSFLENAYRKAIDNRSQLLAVFTAGVDHQHNYRHQLLDAMPRVPFGKQLRLEFFENSDHTFSLASDRRRLFDMVKTWLGTAEFAALGAAPLREVSGLPPAE